jgi:hypothetical protein
MKQKKVGQITLNKSIENKSKGQAVLATRDNKSADREINEERLKVTERS